MKKLLFFIFALSVSTALFAQQAADAGNTPVKFHNFIWGTSLEAFKAGMGEPVHVDQINGLQALVYQNISMAGFRAYIVVYFSQNGLEGGTYYFDTLSLEELMKCYVDVQKELIAMYGPTLLYDVMLREMRSYETSWNLPTGYVYLKTNPRWNEPVSLWFSSPALTRQLRGS